MDVILLPVLLVQGLWVALKAERLPEAAGARMGVTGDGPPLHLLVIGDSSAAGVGVAHQDQALIGHLTKALSQRFTVHWNLEAQTGARTRDGLGWLDGLRGQALDIAVTAFGVNDVTKGVTERDWALQQTELITRLTGEFGVRQVCISPMPPMGSFPALPNPLRRVIGARAERFEAARRAALAGRPDVGWVTLDLPLDPELMARDGYHPGPEVYAFWAQAVLDVMEFEGDQR